MILDFLFPKLCLGCKKEGKYICTDCYSKISSGRSIQVRGMKIVSIFKFDGVIRKAIIQLKYKFATDLVEELSLLVFERIKNKKEFRNITEDSILLPVPMYWQNENKRGFNQANLLGKRIATLLKIKYDQEFLLKSVKTSNQVGLKGKERKTNLGGSFTLNEKKNISKDTKIIVFDDVLTTGSTMKEVYRLLKEYGFKNILGLTVAG